MPSFEWRAAVCANAVVCGFALAALSQAQSPASTNLLVNGSFEEGGAGWQYVSTGAKATGQVDESEKRDGKRSYKLTNQSAQAPNIYARIYQFVPGMQPYATYRVSCWVKGRGCGINWIGGGPGWYTRHAFPQGDFDWRQESFDIESGAAPDSYELMVLTESTTKALWVDDIRFELVKVDHAKADALHEDMARKADSLRRRVQALENQAHAEPRLATNPYLKLGTAVATRFIGFAEHGGPDGRTGLVWSQLQLDEVAQVLDETEKLVQTGRIAKLVWREPKPGRVRLKDATWYEGGRPHYFYGYGHFGSVIADLPNFPALGASLVQDGTVGPSSMNADGTLGEGALAMLRGLDRAAQYGMREDFLLSPHYYPAWGEVPDLHPGNIGWIGFNIFHPKAQETIRKWIEVMSARIKDKPALHSVCLANEPVYITSGRDTYTRPAFTAYLKQKHPDLAELNVLYGTRCKTYDEVPVPPPSMPADVPAQRAYYDWTTFNKEMFAKWHGWMSSLLKENGVKVPTHTKIMVFYTLDRDKLCYGVDPELMCHATDVAGCDAYAFPGGAYAYDWLGHEFFYDLLHSFRGQPVFNSENHVIPDNWPPAHISMNHTRSVMWQDGLHHEGSTTIWVWERASDPSLAGSIYFRPANVYGAGRAMLDLNRLAPEVAALNAAKPRIGLLYSPPSIFWEPKYQGTIYSLYTVLNFMGEPVTFVSERELAEGKAARVQWLIVPQATHILASTPAALARYVGGGTRVLLVGTNSLTRDEYDRPLQRASYPVLKPADSEPATAEALRRELAPLPFNSLRDTTTGQPAWGVEFRLVRHGRSMLLALDNLSTEAKTVSLPDGADASAPDLLSGETVELKAVSLAPMTPRLLRLSR